MKKFNAVYKKYEEERKKISPLKIQRGNFYILKQYVNVDGVKNTYSDADAPILYILYVSKVKDEVHAIKLSETNPTKIKKLFSKLVNENNEIELYGSSKKIYNSSLKKVPNITNETYRTYKWSGIKSIFEFEINDEILLPKTIINKRNI